MRLSTVTTRVVLVAAALIATALATPALAATPTAAAPTGTLELANPDAKAGTDLVFRYTTDQPAALNWVGVYDTPSDGPTDEKYHSPSTAYTYTGAHESGTVTVSGSKLTAGHPITAYLLANDGYTWLAKPVTFTLAAGTTASPSASGTLELETQDATIGDPLTFRYTTDTPNAKNWIGLYNDPSDGPTDQKSHGASTVWRYVDGTSGEMTIPSGALTSGHDIAAYLLYDDGYTWLAKPITFQVKDPPPFDPSPTTSHFVLDDVTLGESLPGESIRASIGGLWFGPRGAAATPATFAKTGGDSWLRVSSSGTITGTAPSAVTDETDPGLIDITATDTSGVTGTMTVEFPLVPKGTAPTLKAATLSMWDAGSHVTAPQEKTVASILRNRLDTVGLQQTGGTQGTAIAKLLGWNRVETAAGTAILSRYPLSSTRTVSGLPVVSARADVDGHGVRIWTADLDADDFGPAVACSSYKGDVVAREKASLRYQQVTALAAAVKDARSSGIPDVLLGAVQSPSAADWTTSTRAQHCGHAPVAWPVPDVLAKAKLVDSFREANPKPTKDPGATQLWIPAATPTTDSAERIDYVDYAGRLSVSESHALVDGFPQAPPNTAANSWISNRAAVVTTFVVGAAHH